MWGIILISFNLHVALARSKSFVFDTSLVEILASSAESGNLYASK